jgi:hypothetical protein
VFLPMVACSRRPSRELRDIDIGQCMRCWMQPPSPTKGCLPCVGTSYIHILQWGPDVNERTRLWRLSRSLYVKGNLKQLLMRNNLLEMIVAMHIYLILSIILSYINFILWHFTFLLHPLVHSNATFLPAWCTVRKVF